jgi:hypothetical protein
VTIDLIYLLDIKIQLFLVIFLHFFIKLLHSSDVNCEISFREMAKIFHCKEDVFLKLGHAEWMRMKEAFSKLSGKETENSQGFVSGQQ